MTASDPVAGGAAADEPVGSVAEEAFKLFRALTVSEGGQTGSHSPEHSCSTAWCPVCQIVGFVRENPDAVATVTQSAAAFARSLRDLADRAFTPQEEQ